MFDREPRKDARKCGHLSDREVLDLFLDGTYRVDGGRVIGRKTNKPLTRLIQKGKRYPLVALSDDDRRRHIAEHKLLWMVANKRTVPAGHWICPRRGLISSKQARKERNRRKKDRRRVYGKCIGCGKPLDAESVEKDYRDCGRCRGRKNSQQDRLKDQCKRDGTCFTCRQPLDAASLGKFRDCAGCRKYHKSLKRGGRPGLELSLSGDQLEAYERIRLQKQAAGAT